jgi:hypothetical protein
VGNNDRYVVQEVIKELARNRPLDVAGALLAAWLWPLALQQWCSYGILLRAHTDWTCQVGSGQ